MRRRKTASSDRARARRGGRDVERRPDRLTGLTWTAEVVVLVRASEEAIEHLRSAPCRGQRRSCSRRQVSKSRAPYMSATTWT